jgi:hypothetical protein
MASGQFSGIKRFFLWDYPRAGWQYDVMVALILAFVFLTPREVFRDQPRPTNVVRLPAEQGTNVFWMEPELLNGIPESERNARAASVIRSRFGRNETLVRVEPILDREQETKGYLVYTRP